MRNVEIDYNKMHDDFIEFFGKMFWIQDLAENGITKPDERQIERWRDAYLLKFDGNEKTISTNMLRAKTQKATYCIMNIVQLNVVYGELPK